MDSLYVQALLQHDIPYVAGPSGMTSLLCAAMLYCGQFSSRKEQNYYILAITAFMTAGGLHSIHEVLTVPRIRLNLIKEYNAQGQLMGNYQAFFDLFADPIIIKKMDRAWDNTIEWINEFLIPNASWNKEKTSKWL